MDIERLKKLRRTLSVHFALIAWLTAMLVATGSDSYFLPVFIFVFSVGAIIFVDSLEWFELGKIGSYVGMAIATIVAVGSWVYSVTTQQYESGQLLAVAGLLVYPEAVLFLQKKTIRVFEQLAIFLLLEMIVAALINDNLLFGILLAPIMLLWVSALFLFSRYATIVSVDPSIEKPVPILAELIFQAFVRKVINSNSSRNRKSSSVSAAALPSQQVQSSRMMWRMLQTIPIGIGALAFAVLFFYLLPRTNPGALPSNISGTATVGLPKDSLTIGQIGRILQDPTPVMRVSFSDYSSPKRYSLLEPPYVRARVFDKYVQRNNSFAAKSEWVNSGVPDFGSIPSLEYGQSLLDMGTDPVSVGFSIKRDAASVLYTVAPAFAPHKDQSMPLRYDWQSGTLQPLDASSDYYGRALEYELGTSAFLRGRQIRVTPAFIAARFFGGPNVDRLRATYGGFPLLESYTNSLLKRKGVAHTSALEASLAIEEQFVDSGEFEYSLELSPPSDPTVDPLEDFVVNVKRGHCQYYASAMVLMMREMGIPARIVVGYRPSEFNQVGGYFPVKQSDAHAWVEGLFSRSQFADHELEKWLPKSNSRFPHRDFFWVRFDPTPSGGNRDIVTQRGQTFDYAEKLWKDYVIDRKQLASQGSLYSPSEDDSKSAYEEFGKQLSELQKQLRSGNLSGFLRFRFAWPLTLVVIAIGVLGLLLWRLAVVLPNWAPSLARRLGLRPRSASQVTEAFYARCLELLERSGIYREPYQTTREFTDAAALQLQEETGEAEITTALADLTRLYYKCRFHPNQRLDLKEQAVANQALRCVERVVAMRPAPRAPTPTG